MLLSILFLLFVWIEVIFQLWIIIFQERKYRIDLFILLNMRKQNSFRKTDNLACSYYSYLCIRILTQGTVWLWIWYKKSTCLNISSKSIQNDLVYLVYNDQSVYKNLIKFSTVSNQQIFLFYPEKTFLETTPRSFQVN